MRDTNSASIEAIYDQMAALYLPLRDGPLRDIADALSGGFEGHAAERPITGDTPGQDPYNRIPGTPSGGCFSELVVYCYDKDSFSVRVAEMTRHLTSLCPNTRLAVLVTSRWNPGVWRRNQDALRRSAAEVIVILKSPMGPIRIA